MSTHKHNLADLSRFHSPTPKILSGNFLAEIEALQRSITRHGLLNPLVASACGSDLTVLDGRKRLIALRRMTFSGGMPASLSQIPFMYVDEYDELPANPMNLRSNAEQYELVHNLRAAGFSVAEISRQLFCSEEDVQALLRVSALSPQLRKAFLHGVLNLPQVRAFSTIPNPGAQDALVMALGPFAQEEDVLDALSRGETILNIDPENVIVLPSRGQYGECAIAPVPAATPTSVPAAANGVGAPEHVQTPPSESVRFG